MTEHMPWWRGWKEVTEDSKDREVITELTLNEENGNCIIRIKEIVWSNISSVCYPCCGSDISIANEYNNTVHIDTSFHSIKALQDNWYDANQEDVLEHNGTYDLVIISRPNVKSEALAKLVSPWWYIMVENARAHWNYFYNSSEYELIENLTTKEKKFKTRELWEYQFTTWDTNRYLFQKKHPQWTSRLGENTSKSLTDTIQ